MALRECKLCKILRIKTNKLSILTLSTLTWTTWVTMLTKQMMVSLIQNQLRSKNWTTELKWPWLSITSLTIWVKETLRWNSIRMFNSMVWQGLKTASTNKDHLNKGNQLCQIQTWWPLAFLTTLQEATAWFHSLPASTRLIWEPLRETWEWKNQAQISKGTNINDKATTMQVVWLINYIY